jgi:hypothetical protein
MCPRWASFGGDVVDAGSNSWAASCSKCAALDRGSSIIYLYSTCDVWHVILEQQWLTAKVAVDCPQDWAMCIIKVCSHDRNRELWLHCKEAMSNMFLS